MSEPRTYRFSAPDRTGALLGLSAGQVAGLGLGVVVAVVAGSMGAGVLGMAIPVALGSVAAFVRVGGQPLVEAAPPGLRYGLITLRRRRRWQAPLVSALSERDTPELPPPLAGQQFLAVDPAEFGLSVSRAEPAVVVFDTKADTYAATLRASGAEFALVGRSQQDSLLARWGVALAGFCRERGVVASVRWSEWAAPGGAEEELAYLKSHGNDDETDPAVQSYRGLLNRAKSLSTRHEVLITVTVGADRVPVATRHKGDRQRACLEALMGQVEQLSNRCRKADLAVSDPLSAPELARALRVRLDPTVIQRLDRRGRALGDLAGLVSPANGGPLACELSWRYWLVDDSYHRSFWMSDWPRQPVTPNWMSDLILYGHVRRSIVVIHEPVSPRASQKAVDSAAVKLLSDKEHRHRTGFRVGAHHRRASEAVDEREEELASGYGEFTYAGVVVVSAPSLEALDKACADVDDVATGCGIELRALNGRHDLGVSVSLPLARALAPKRL
ncbi:MAG: hypothetical protein QOE58_3617 [Actinomycetota bacterium]|jgi:hypothetical protein|nr:hypothetical protein [Actinomycetota bacterium]